MPKIKRTGTSSGGTKGKIGAANLFGHKGGKGKATKIKQSGKK